MPELDNTDPILFLFLMRALIGFQALVKIFNSLFLIQSRKKQKICVCVRVVYSQTAGENRT